MLLFFSPCISSAPPPSSTCSALLLALLHPRSASLLSPSVCRQTAATYQTARGAGTLLKPPLTHPAVLSSLPSSHSRHKLLAAAIYRLTAAVVSLGIAGGRALCHHFSASSRAMFFPLYQQTLHGNGFKVWAASQNFDFFLHLLLWLTFMLPSPNCLAVSV